jgi:hypothetical protein
LWADYLALKRFFIINFKLRVYIVYNGMWIIPDNALRFSPLINCPKSHIASDRHN